MVDGGDDIGRHHSVSILNLFDRTFRVDSIETSEFELKDLV